MSTLEAGAGANLNWPCVHETPWFSLPFDAGTETKIIEAHDFFTAIANGTSVSPNFADGYQTALIDDAIVESAETDAWVDVPGIG